MKKTLRSVMMAGVAMLALGASAQTLETVWEYTENIPGSAGGGEYRFGAAVDGKLIVTNKAGSQIVYWDETNQGAVLHDMNEFFAANFLSAGTAINSDDAGNIIVNTNFPNASSATDWIIIPAYYGSDWKVLKLDLGALGIAAARVDQIGRIVGNMLSNKGAYMWLCPKDETKIAIIKVVNGVQDEVYSAASTAPGFSLSTSCVAQPMYLTVSEIDALMDENGDNTPSFWLRNRSSARSVYKWNAEATAMEAISMTGIAASGQSAASGTAEGFEVFTLQGKTYFVVPMGDTTGKSRDAAFGVYMAGENEKGELEGKLVASYTALSKAGVGQYNSFAVEACDENSVYIYRWLPSVQAAKFKFSLSGKTSVECVAVVAEEVPAVYYNLQGVSVANPENGLYIVKRGNKVSKELIVN